MIDQNREDYLIIHYSCESFYDLKGKSPRISSIAVRNLQFEQSYLFTIYKSAEKKNIEFENIVEHYEEVEKSMLEDFYEFMKMNQHKKWMHWNMRDSIFGFKALEHRFSVLGGKPYFLEDSRQVGVANLFKKLYGSKYARDPKMISLMELNNIKPKNFLSGKEEADAFEKNNFYELSMSTAGKVNMISEMIDLASDNQLVTEVKRSDLYGEDIKGKWYSLKERSWFTTLCFVMNTIFSGIVGYIISSVLG